MVRRLRAFVFILAALVLGASPHAGRQSTPVTILGSVVDAALLPLSGVAVTLEANGRAVGRTTTAPDGAFRFENVPAGDYRVRAERAGYPAAVKEVRVASGAPTMRVPLVLARADESIEAVAAREEAARVATDAAQRAAATPPSGAAGGRGAAGAAVTGAAGGLGGVLVVQPSAAPVGAPIGTVEMGAGAGGRQGSAEPVEPWAGYRFAHSRERYARIEPNRFQPAWTHPLSTFGADVDTASYTNVRRFLTQGRLPPPEAVRVEEFVNYFGFDYAAPRDGRPLALTAEVGDCPWAPGHKLVLIGARARAAIEREVGRRNLVLLVDVSGSMAPPERLPLLKEAFAMFVDSLRPTDRVAIVTYAGTSGVALTSTPVTDRERIQRALARLGAGGSTNGASGLRTAYRIAREAFIPGGMNRVILATDGDFNVGVTGTGELTRLIERERDSGVFLSVLGVGTGNLNDRMMESVADRGNGHYAYLDSIQEARRVLVRASDQTIETVAKDVKFQVEFNPAVVREWKLLGYENRRLAPEDFNDDRKDGGELGAGHTVTVLYEIVPVGAALPDERPRPRVDALRYQAGVEAAAHVAAPAPPRGAEWLIVKARYKDPDGEASELISRIVRPGQPARVLPAAAAIAEFGLLLRDAPRETDRWNGLLYRARRATPPTREAREYAEFLELLEVARSLGAR
jgi:Ca-activated chloride channel family protein